MTYLRMIAFMAALGLVDFVTTKVSGSTPVAALKKVVWITENFSRDTS